MRERDSDVCCLSAPPAGPEEVEEAKDQRPEEGGAQLPAEEDGEFEHIVVRSSRPPALRLAGCRRPTSCSAFTAEALQMLIVRVCLCVRVQENQERAKKNREEQRERELQFKRQQREQANQGAAPFFLKKCEFVRIMQNVRCSEP